ncbi:hypothetical protein Pcinc_042438 [Petrolisthes cinctipes]|uniref:Cytochrome P450 n=1 Tax=Petrolisthes cinctipes TaxID=88211 RepID=A0AAE1BHI3_PETCI|nr:hypothetical protein Pcinc_042438 [Petrolisthes cinctipes]
MLVTLVLVVTAIVTAVYAYSRYRHNYWAARGVPTAPNLLPLIGHFHTQFVVSKKKPRWLYTDEAYYHGGSWLCGTYDKFKPVLMIGDPDIVKAVLIKDFDHFVDRRKAVFASKRDKIFSGILTVLTGEQWKGVRSLLSPIFTSGKMKGLFRLVEQKADELTAYIHREIKANSKIKIRKAFGFYSLEVISSCAFGMETNTLADGDSIFNQKVQAMSKISTGRVIKFLFFMLFPKLFQALGVNLTVPETEFFKEVVEEAMRKRENQEHKRGDFLDLMMEARKDQNNPNAKPNKYTITDELVVSNAILFILAGFDTTANTLCFVAYMLALNPEEQQRLRQEVRDIIKDEGELTYQGLLGAKFLDAVINETLRLHPTAHFTERQCTKDYTIPGTNVTLRAKDMVMIPVWSIHRDEKHWPEPEKFRPDRFLPENKDQIRSGTFLPFGLGPRNCIGMRFALMEAKLALAKMVLNFEMSCEPGKEEIDMDSSIGLMRPSEECSLIFTPLE